MTKPVSGATMQCARDWDARSAKALAPRTVMTLSGLTRAMPIYALAMENVVPSEKQLAETKCQVRKRLEALCSHLPPNDFEQLVHKIALNELKSPSVTASKRRFTWKLDDE